MRKVKRNEPCLCGSGKKYKKCCGSPTAPKADAQTINQNLLQLHQQLISEISTEYSKTIEELMDSYSKLKPLDEEAIEVFKTGLIPWIVSHVPNAVKENTIMEHFIANRIIPMHTKVYFEKWATEVPSVYEVVAVDKPVKHYAMIKKLGTDQLFHIPYHHSNELTEGGLLIGTLVPFADYHNFLYTMIKLYHRETTGFTNLLKQYSDRTGGLKENFPDFLTEALVTGMDSLEWGDEAYEEVAQLFVDHMLEKNIDDEAISKGITLWREYSSTEQPTIKKVEAYAAALDYYVQKEIVVNLDQTQGKIADEYDISPGTLSKIYRSLMIHNESN